MGKVRRATAYNTDVLFEESAGRFLLKTCCDESGEREDLDLARRVDFSCERATSSDPLEANIHQESAHLVHGRESPVQENNHPEIQDHK